MSTIDQSTTTQILLRNRFCIAHQQTNQLWTYNNMAILTSDYQCNATNQIQCKTTKWCVDKEYQCDGQLDCCADQEGSGDEEVECQDKTDEENCGMNVLTLSGVSRFYLESTQYIIIKMSNCVFQNVAMMIGPKVGSSVPTMSVLTLHGSATMKQIVPMEVTKRIAVSISICFHASKNYMKIKQKTI